MNKDLLRLDVEEIAEKTREMDLAPGIGYFVRMVRVVEPGDDIILAKLLLFLQSLLTKDKVDNCAISLRAVKLSLHRLKNISRSAENISRIAILNSLVALAESVYQRKTQAKRRKNAAEMAAAPRRQTELVKRAKKQRKSITVKSTSNPRRRRKRVKSSVKKPRNPIL